MPIAPNKVVARYLDGRLLKGFTFDFSPARPVFHVTAAGAAPGGRPIEVALADLKAVFFVKDLVGDAHYNERKEFAVTDRPVGRKVAVRFRDGEVLVGTTQGYDRSRPGFFMIPVDPSSNIDRCFVIGGSAAEISVG